MSKKMPTKGVLTFEAEGSDSSSSPYYSRVLHHPTMGSGVTIGRGYDMKDRSSADVEKDFVAAGLSADVAKKYAKGAGLTGSEARTFVTNNKGVLPELTWDQQLALFESTYAWHEKDVKRICDKEDCQNIYGVVDFKTLHPRILDVLVDLRFRGDYTPASRKRIQKLVVENDYARFRADLSNRSNWSAVPEDRFDRRSKYLKDAPQTDDTADHEDVTYSTPTKSFDLKTMGEAELYDHLRSVWKAEQKAFGNEGKPEFDFQDEEGRVNLLGARGFDADQMVPVPSTNTKYDDTLFLVYKKDGAKHVEKFHYSSEWTRTGSKGAVIILGQHKYCLAIHKKLKEDGTPYPYNKLPAWRDYYNTNKTQPPGAGYRALNPDPTVGIVRVHDASAAGSVGAETTGVTQNASINIHYGGEVPSGWTPSKGWSDGCQVLMRGDRYLRFMEVIESDHSLKGTINNELAPKPSADGKRSLIYTLVKGDSLAPRDAPSMGFPVDIGKGKKIDNSTTLAMFEHTEKTIDSGYFPLGTNTTWHGGAHLHVAEGTAVHAMFDGRIVAARLPAAADKSKGAFGSRNFILIRHEIDGDRLNKANALLKRTLIGYTIRAETLVLRKEPGNAAAVVDTLKVGDEVLLKTVPHPKKDGVSWAHVVVSKSAKEGLKDKVGYVAATSLLVTPRYAPPKERVKPSETRVVYSLYMHLGPQALDTTNSVLASIPWVSGAQWSVSDDVRLRSAPGVPDPDKTQIGTLVSGDTFVQLTPDLVTAGSYQWMKVRVTKAKDAKLANKEGFVAKLDKRMSLTKAPSAEILDKLKSGDVVKLDKPVVAGEQIWTAGTMTGASGGAQAGIHWEVFSEQPLFPDWPSADDPDENLNMDVKKIFDMIEQEFWGYNDTISASELNDFYKNNPKAKSLRYYACRFMSEWGCDIDKAVAQIQSRGLYSVSGLADKMRPYLWWKEAEGKKVELPKSPIVWHYNPIGFVYAMTKIEETPAPRTEPAQTKEDPKVATETQWSGVAYGDYVLKKGDDDGKQTWGGLARKEKGTYVVELQKDLLELGYWISAASSNKGMNADGNFGGTVRGAVMLFQREHGLKETGEVDAATAKLIKEKTKVANYERPGHKAGDYGQFYQLPPSENYERYDEVRDDNCIPKDNWGTKEMIKMLTSAGKAWKEQGKSLFLVGDVSLYNGGKMDPHKSHQDGTGVDLDSDELCSINRATFKKEESLSLTQLLIKHGAKRVLFNCKYVTDQVPEAFALSGHHHHYHVDVKPGLKTNEHPEEECKWCHKSVYKKCDYAKKAKRSDSELT
ncbi:penicillin-insensitive murein endopeptidase [Polyangium jinanense]|uniref:penicillin-insensitive murein endopeptidase n=1 Tax=Polyangium jinanense TaxID=2829994 RepID=UPI0023415D3D|nr:penicillin-insensitive murein endopeptidase [Polyangium jinanense]MDC3956759.1 penicillin-insensitive murein endopeptidase [Polyangium jinanense]